MEIREFSLADRREERKERLLRRFAEIGGFYLLEL